MRETLTQRTVSAQICFGQVYLLVCGNGYYDKCCQLSNDTHLIISYNNDRSITEEMLIWQNFLWTNFTAAIQ